MFLVTLARVRRSRRTKVRIAETEVFGAKIDAARAEERALIVADAEAIAAVQFADQDLDASVDFVGRSARPRWISSG